MQPRSRYLIDYLKIGATQGLNYLVPLIIMPILVRTVGKENFGIISYSQSIAGYFLILINYSFDLTATRDLAGLKTHKAKNILFNEVLQTKILLFLFSIVIFVSILYISNDLRQNRNLHVVFFLSNFAYVLYQPWYFQGEQMYNKALLLNLFTKLLWGIGVFYLVSGRSDSLLYAQIFLMSQIILGIGSFIYLLISFRLKIIRIQLESVLKTISKGKSIFLANLLANFSALSNIVILGYVATMENVGNFSAGNKLISVITSVVITSFTLYSYPLVAKKIGAGEASGSELIQTNIWLSILGGLGISSALLLSSAWLIPFIFGEEFTNSVQTFRVLSIIPFFIFVNNVLIVHGMLNFKMDKEFFRITVCAATTNVILNFVLSSIYQDKGTAAAWLITECTIMVLAYKQLSKQIKVLNIDKIANFKTLFR